jgi:hypothetical protein
MKNLACKVTVPLVWPFDTEDTEKCIGIKMQRTETYGVTQNKMDEPFTGKDLEERKELARM